MKRRALALFSSLLLLGLVPGTALAGTAVHDQVNMTADHYLQGAYIEAQTFTAGIDGTLAGVLLYLGSVSSSVNVYATVQTTAGSPALPTGTVLASKTTTGISGGGNWTNFLFVSSPRIAAGQVYAIVFNATSNGTNEVAFGSKADLYSGGRALVFSGGSWIAPTSLPSNPQVSDWTFQTLVNADPPAPTAPPAPTRAPAPTAAPTTAPTAAPTATDTPTDTPIAAPTATDTPTATPTDTSAPGSVASAPPAAPGGGSGSGSGSSGDSTMLIVLAGIVLAGLLGGGLLLMFLRRRGQATG